KTVSFAGALLGSNSVSNLGSGQGSLVYAKGYLFARNLNSLYRINTSTWTSTLVTVDSSHPLVTASSWMTYNIFETPSGQIGSIGTAPNPVVKLYNVSSDGLTLTFARSVTLSDTWAPDEHGTASDGTYLYRLSANAGYKVYSLATGAVVYDGSSATTGWSLTNADSGGTMNNTTFITREHITGRYFVGDYSSNRFMVSVPTANGFESTITGYATGDSASVITGAITYAGTATTATNTGTYTITSVVSALTASNYTFAVGTDSTLTINKATLTYTADAKTKVYNSQPFTAFTSTITGYQGTDTVSVVSGAVSYTGAGTTATNYSATAYTITPDVSALTAGNYVFASANGGLTITKAVLTVTPDAKTKVYDSKVYTNALPFTSTITGYFGSDTGSVITGVPTYSGTATTGTAVGSHTITSVIGAMSAANYTFVSANGTLTITKAVLIATPDAKTKVYNSAIYSGGYSTTYTGFFGSDTTSVISGTITYTGAAMAATNVGSYTITTVIGNLTASNYTFQAADNTLSITKATITVTASAKSKTYDSLIFSGGYTYTTSGYFGSDTSSVISGTVTYTGSAMAATTYSASNYVITPDVSGLSASNYVFASANGVLTINKAILTVTPDAKSKTYDNAVFTNAQYSSTITGYFGSDTGSVITGSPTYSGTAMAAKAAGSYTITSVIGGMSATNYTFAPANGTLTINKAVLTVTPQNKTFTYDATAQGSTGGAKTYLTNSPYTMSSDGTNPYTINMDLGQNWTFQADYKKNSTNNNDWFFSYGLDYANGSITGWTNGVVTSGWTGGWFILQGANSGAQDAFGGATTNGAFVKVLITYTNDGSTGTLKVYVGGVLKSTVTKSGSLDPADKTIRLGAGPFSKGFDGEVKNIVIKSGTSPFNYDVTGYASGDTSSVISGSIAYSGSGTTAVNAGTYSLSTVVSGFSASNYTFAPGADATVTINKATLTYTADAKTKVYNSQPFTAFTSTITGYKGSDTVAVVSGAVGYTGTGTTATNYSATAYTITPDVSALSADNYVFASANGGLTITKAVLTVTPDAKTKVYDNKVYTNSLPFTSTITGYFGSDTGSVITGVPTYSGTATTATNYSATPYTITSVIGGMSAANYTFASANGNLTITKAVLTVTPNPFVKTYDSLAMGTTTSTRALQKSTANIINGPGGSGGIATDGTNIYVSDGSNIKKISYTGTLLATNAVANLGGIQHSIAYAKGYLYSRNGSSLYRVSTTTWASTLVSVDASYPLLNASGYMYYSLFDTPSGQLGVMGTSPNPVIRFYNVSSDGLTLTFARSVTLNDTWSIDEHGIASDGDYLYRITSYSGYKVYSLSTGNVVYDGRSSVTGWDMLSTDSGGTMTNPWMMAHDHVTGRYIVSNYGTGKILISSPSFNSTITGYATGDNASVISGSITYTGDATTATNTGTYTLTSVVSSLSASNYTFAVGSNSTLTINKATLTYKADAKTKVYDSQPFTAFTSTITGYQGTDTVAVVSGAVSYTGTGTTATTYSATAYTITPDVSALSADNYVFASANGGLTITKAVLTVTPDAKTKVYDNKVYTNSLPFTSTITGYQGSDTGSVITGVPTYSGTATTATNYSAAPYTITSVIGGMSAANYTFASANGNLTITKAVLTVTPQNKTFTYDATAQGSGGGATTYLTDSPYTLSGNGANPYIINKDLGQNWSFQADFKIGSSNAWNWFFSYGTYSDGILLSTLRTDGFYLKGASSGATNVFGSSTDFVKVLVTYTNDGSTGTLKVYAADILLKTVTSSGLLNPASKSIRLGSATHANTEGFDGQVKNIVISSGTSPFTYAVTGYATGDSSSVISGSVAYSGTGTTAVNAGTYGLSTVVSGFSASNYTFAAGADATVTINKATLTYTADAKTKVYNSQPFTAFTSTITGYKGSDTVAVVSGAVSYTGTGTTATTYSASSYTIMPDVSALSAGNYVFASANGGLTITKAVLTVTPDAKTKSYDGKVYTNALPFTSTITGFFGSDTLSVITGVPTYSGTATTAINYSATPYTITSVIGAMSAANYTFASANGNLTITKALLTVTSDPKTKTYDGGLYTDSFNSTLGGLTAEYYRNKDLTGSPHIKRVDS
ncbi:MAG: MBG domain-containing protein, partial [Planctomycetota bacterium]